MRSARRGPFRGLPPEVAILTTVSFTVALGFGIVAPVIPAFARQFGVSVTEAAGVISVFALMRVVGALPAGRLVDRFGEPGVMAAGIALVSVSSILAGLSRSFAELLVLRGSGGVGSAMFSISAQALLLGSVPGEQRGRASGLFSGGFLVGGISGPAVGGLIAAWSLRAPFFIYGGLLVVPAGLAAVVLRRRPNHRPAAAGQPPVSSLAALGRAVRSRTYRAAASANLADGFAALGVRGALVPLFVRDVLHRSVVWTGIGFLLFAALNGAALLPGGRIADTVGRRPVIIAGCLISAVGMVMLALLPGPWAYLAALAVAGFGSGLLDVAPAAMIGDIIDSGGGTLVASYQMAGDVGSVVGPVAGGFLVDSASYAAAFGLAAAVLSGAAILGFFSPETGPGVWVGTPPEPAAADPDPPVHLRPAARRRLTPPAAGASYGYPVASWAEHAIWWQVYPLGFTGAEKAALPAEEPVRHRLAQLAGWLDYAAGLGCSGLLLGPVFAAESHGYDTVDHFEIDPRLGDQADFDHLVAEATQRGLRIVLDGVFNHVGRSFPAFQAALAGGPGSPAARWFRRDPATGEYATFEGHHQLVALDHAEPEVLDYVAQVMTYWLDRGAAGWRLDAAYAVPARFWAKVLPGVRESHPDAWFVGEIIHGDYVAYAAESGLDSITQYELWKALWSSLNDRNFFELAWSLDRHNQVLDGVVPQTFTGNHDVTRLASQLTDERHFGHALAVLLTVGGVPSIYYGDEQGFRGVKEQQAGGDDEIRPAFPASPAELPPDGWPVYRLHQRLIGFRRRHPWLVRARTSVEHLANETIAFRAAADDAGILVLLNAGDASFRFPVDVAGLAVAETPDPGARPADPVLVPGHSWVILSA